MIDGAASASLTPYGEPQKFSPQHGAESAKYTAVTLPILAPFAPLCGQNRVEFSALRFSPFALPRCAASPFGFAPSSQLSSLTCLSPTHRLPTTPTAAPSLRPKILTVDDSKTVRLLAQSVLHDFDCDVSEADNGFKALFAMERTLPDLILLDVNMPTMGGVEMLTLLASKPQLKAIPVIMLTSPADHAISAQLAALGVSGTLMKPFTPAELLAKIRGVLDLKPLRSP
jgi:two-component system, chemotaxis family, chemotaxis protein CheY